jgi:CubicO group peptidase (beta-lactamase class C family)
MKSVRSAARRLPGLQALIIFAISMTIDAWAGDLPRARPQEVGFSAERLAYIDRFYGDKVKKGEMAGIVTLIARHGKVAHFSAVGYADAAKKTKLETDTIFRLYSMTKPIASTALMMLYEEGRFQLSDPVSKYIPEFANLRVMRDPNGRLDDTVPASKPPTMQDVFRHTVGFSHGLMENEYDAQYTKANVFGLDVSLAEMMTRLSKIPLRHQPGTQYLYGVGPDIQARLVEVLSGMPFDAFLEKRLFQPLGMRDAGFWALGDKAKRLATVHWDKQGKLTPLDEKHGYPQGGALFQPWSVNSYTAKHKHLGGSFGLVSTAEDYWRFAQMMLNGGQLEGVRILSPQTVRYMARDHLGKIGMDTMGGAFQGTGFGLGFAVVQDPAAAGYMSSEGTFYWGGAAGTVFWIDPKENLAVVAMTQHMSVPAIASLWTDVRTLVYSALME